MSKSPKGCLDASTQTSTSSIGRIGAPTKAFSVHEGDTPTREVGISSRSRWNSSSADSRESGLPGGQVPRRGFADVQENYRSLDYRPRNSGPHTNDSPRNAVHATSAGTFNVPHFNNNRQSHSTRVGIWENPPPVLKRPSEYSDESSRKRR